MSTSESNEDNTIQALVLWRRQDVKTPRSFLGH